MEVIASSNLDAPKLIEKLRAQSEIEYAVLDRRRHRHALPNDPRFSDQWYLQSAEPAALKAIGAWDTTVGSNGIVVAVLDSGIRFDHPDLAPASQGGRILPGYDFISGDSGSTTQFFTANDGDGRDADPTDPGDWVDDDDRRLSFFSNCTLENSSWHGTRVAGLIGAGSNNTIGIAGTTWETWILPVRVLGKCGGYDADILEAMRWAAGLQVPGVPDNPYPAQIINLSLGLDAVCSAPYRSVIQELTSRGVVIVASAGNSGGPVEEPANCPGVIAVAGLRHAGTKVGYSSLGPEIALSAPAGNCVNLTGACLFSLHTTYDVGRTRPAGPGYTDQFTTNLGTSFSAPLVAGVSALMLSVNARLQPEHLATRLKESASPFPDGGAQPPTVCHVPMDSNDIQARECVCTTETCGAGMLNSASAVIAAQRPIAHIITPVNVTAGALLTIDGSMSSAACNRTIAMYRWSIVAVQGTSSPVLTGSDQSSTQIPAPVSGTYTLRLTVTDNMGATDTGDLLVTNTSASSTTIEPLTRSACPVAIASLPLVVPPTATPTSTPVSPEQSGGGGGLFNVWMFCLLTMLLFYRASRVKPSSSCRSS